MRTIFTQDLFWTPRLGADDISSLSPETRRDRLDDAYTPVLEGWFKTMDIVNQHGGMGDKLKALLGPDYDNFVKGFYVESEFFNKVEKVIQKTGSDPSLWPTITQADFDTIDQWKYLLGPLEEIVAKHTGPQAPQAAIPGSQPAAAGGGFPTTTVIAGVGVAGIGALLYSIL